MANIDRRTLLGASLAAAAMPWCGAPALGADRLLVGFVLPGPIGEYGWALAHDRGRAALAAALGDRVQVIAMPNTGEDASALPVIRDLALQGCGLIFATSAGYSEQTLKVAPEFPKVAFEVCGGQARAENVATYDARFHEGRAVLGTIAGMLARSGTLGYLGSYESNQVVLGANAFLLAAQRHNPEARLKLALLNAWFDPPGEIAAIERLAAQGAEIFASETDSPAALQTLERLGLKGFGQTVDLAAFAPGAQLTAIEVLWGAYYIARTKAVLDGTWSSGHASIGMAEGALATTRYGEAVPAEVALEADRVRAGYQDGTFDIFTGPIYDQTGRLRVPAGDRLDRGQLASMDWFVRGVESADRVNATAGAAE